MDSGSADKMSLKPVPVDGTVPEQAGGRDMVDRGADNRLARFYEMLQPMVKKRLQPEAVKRLPRQEVAHQVSDIVMEVLDLEPDAPDLLEQRSLVATLVNDLVTAANGGAVQEASVSQAQAAASASKDASP